MPSTELRSDPKGLPMGLSLPVVMGPIQLPDPIRGFEPKRKRRWGWLLAWTLLVFAGGIAAGPVLTNKAFSLIERVVPMLGLPVPQFVAENAQVTPIAPAPARRAGAALPQSEEIPTAEQAATAPTPAASAGQATPPNLRGVVVRPLPASEPKAELPPAPAAPAPAPPKAKFAPAPAARGIVPKTRPRAVASAGASAPQGAEHFDPFESGDSAPKPVAAKSHDPLDGLMAGMGSDRKGAKNESKDIDAMLKEVQKPNPAPAPKRAPPPELPSLSSDDIFKAMAVVKTRGSECSRRLGQTGVAELKLTVGKDGRVTNVHLAGKLAGTPLADCIVQAARAASFPPNSGLRFDYRIDAR